MKTARLWSVVNPLAPGLVTAVHQLAGLLWQTGKLRLIIYSAQLIQETTIMNSLKPDVNRFLGLR
jgi:hypothetical protein